MSKTPRLCKGFPFQSTASRTHRSCVLHSSGVTGRPHCHFILFVFGHQTRSSARASSSSTAIGGRASTVAPGSWPYFVCHSSSGSTPPHLTCTCFDGTRNRFPALPIAGKREGKKGRNINMANKGACRGTSPNQTVIGRLGFGRKQYGNERRGTGSWFPMTGNGCIQCIQWVSAVRSVSVRVEHPQVEARTKQFTTAIDRFTQP